jgi:polyisoprenoid-binding protein YceI
MKTLKNLLLLALFTATTLSFTNLNAQQKEIKIATSKVIWKGYKVTGAHEGTISLKSGLLNFNNDKLVGGEFVMNMQTIEVTDLTGEYKGKLEGHLKSDDFFSVEKHSTATLVITKVDANGKNAYKVTGDLTIKGIKKAITFDLSVYGNKANATLKIDRTKYDVKYGSTSFFDNLKDKAIYDEFDLVADLEF